MSAKKKIIDGSVLAGAAASAAMALFEAAGYWHGGGEIRFLAVSLIFSLAAGAFFILMLKKNLYAWLAGFLLGVVIGLIQSAQLWIGETFDGEFFVSLATMLFFAVLGLVVGATAEFIRLLHFTAHGGKFRNYPSRSDGDKPSAPRPPL